MDWSKEFIQIIKTSRCGESQDFMTTSQVAQLIAPESYDETEKDMLN